MDLEVMFQEHDKTLRTARRAGVVFAFIWLTLLTAGMGGCGWAGYRLITHFTGGQ